MNSVNGTKKVPDEVIVVGAGPCGLLLALQLDRRGIPVTIVERNRELDKRPRATHYGPPAVRELIRAGIFEDAAAAGFHPGTVTWRKPDGTPIMGMPMSSTEKDYPYPMVVLPIGNLSEIINEHIKLRPRINVLWGCKVVDVGQDEDEAWIEIESSHTGTKKTLKAPWIIGTDGATSVIRRMNGLTFDGLTWDKQLIASNVRFDFDKRFGWTDSNFIISREHWYMAARISRDGLWRVAYGELNGLTDQELIDRQAMKFQTMIPGSPKPSEYKLVSISPYKIHQRRANKFRHGRFLLAGDAAHICNPFGGLGLTGGIADAGNLADAMIGVILGVADDSILDKYSEIRIKVYDDIVNPISTDNLHRIADQDAETALENDPFLQMLATSEDIAATANGLHDKIFEISHDFTQYYKEELPPLEVITNGCS